MGDLPLPCSCKELVAHCLAVLGFTDAGSKERYLPIEREIHSLYGMGGREEWGRGERERERERERDSETRHDIINSSKRIVTLHSKHIDIAMETNQYRPHTYRTCANTPMGKRMFNIVHIIQIPGQKRKKPYKSCKQLHCTHKRIRLSQRTMLLYYYRTCTVKYHESSRHVLHECRRHECNTVP